MDRNNAKVLKGLPGDPTPFLNINTTVAGEVQPWPMICLKDRDVHEFFDLDAGLTRVPIQEWLYPPFEPRVLEETTNNKVIIDEWGIKQKVSKLGNRVPQFLEGPVKNREDFQRLKKERLDPDHPGRFPNNWDELAKSYQHRNYHYLWGLSLWFLWVSSILNGRKNILRVLR